jgi:acyl-CoA oxidase
VLTKAAGELLTLEIISPRQSMLLADVYREEVLGMSAREAVQITEAFGFTDYELGSVLGRFDGRVYETLWEEVQRDPVNVEGGFTEDIQSLRAVFGKNQSKL